MEQLEPLDPAIELKVPLPEWDTLSTASLEATNEATMEGTPSPKTDMAAAPQSVYPPAGRSEDGLTESREGPQTESKHERSEGTNVEQPTAQQPDQAISQSTGQYPPIRLVGLTDLIGLERYHKSQASSLQNELDNLTLVDGLNKRLLPIVSMAYQEMADCYYSGDQVGFANLYQTCEDLVEACKSHDLQRKPTGGLRHSVLDQEQLAPGFWFERIPQDCQEYFLEFLTRLRTDPHFLADRLSALSFMEFTELCNSSHTLQSSNSVFGVHHQRKTSGHNRNSSLQDKPSLLEKLRHFNEGEPFFALFHSVFDSSCGLKSEEYSRRTRLWSTACARVITEGKPGSDEFTTATLNAFSLGSTWSLAPRLETYIGKILQDGAFLLDPASKGPPNLKEPLEIRNANAAIATSKFFDRALKELLAILLDTPPANIMPDGLLDLIRAILGRISTSEVRSRAKNFIASKWYISSLLGRILNHPESHGMMIQYHIGINARNTILKEITSRLQKQIFEVQFTWKSSVPLLDPEMHGMVQQLLARLDPVPSDCSDDAPALPSNFSPDEHSLMLSAHDAASLIRSLFPIVNGSIMSTNLSTAGSSTLIPDPVENGERNKANTPSLSGTSTPSATTLSLVTTQSWLNHRLVGPMTDGKKAFPLVGRTATPLGNLENWLIRVYGYLTSLSLQTPTAVADGSAKNWAIFATDIEGKVQRLRPHNIAAGNDNIRGERDHTAKIVGDSSSELRLCIIQLLAREGLGASVLHSWPGAEANHVEEVTSGLKNLISAAQDRASVNYDYQEMHYWWQMQQLLQDHGGPTDSLLRSIYDECQESINIHSHVSRGIEKQLYALTFSRRAQVDRLQAEHERRKALRFKMWYASDVRHSSTFEDALHVTQALRAMAYTSRSKQASGVANWARQRLKNVTWQDRSTAQTVEALTEPNEYSGTCKLNDDQVERTTRWLTRHSIEDFCRGEERIQRFCFEIQRCVNKLSGATLLESPVLWSSRLFEREKRSFDHKSSGTDPQALPHTIGHPSSASSRYSHNYWAYPQLHDQAAMLDTSKSSPALHASSPKEPVRSLPFRTSYAPTTLPDSVWLPSFPNHGSKEEIPVNKVDGAKEQFTADVKKHLCSLILSDLGYLLWHDGTETDAWVKLSSLDDDLASPQRQHDNPTQMGEQEEKLRVGDPQATPSPRGDLQLLLLEATSAFQDSRSRWQIKQHRGPTGAAKVPLKRRVQDQARAFPYRITYKGILERFSLSQDPQSKLRMLHQLEHLVSHSIQHSISPSTAAHPPSKSNLATSLGRSQSILVPRTKATSFEEVIANCTERRAGTMRFSKAPKTPSISPDVDTSGTDEIVNTFLSIFRDLELRPSTLFRDLQYIAAFVPAEILDQTPQGKAFWDAGLAALALKQELCDAMIARATDITNYHISASSSSPNPPPPVRPRKSSLAHTTLQDAAHIWIIAAKEGSATAARELGLLYLTHPEVLPRTTLQPFSKPKEVFRMVSARKEGATTAMEEGRLDPVTFAVVFHWMEVAANGGDKDARDFLRGNGEWGMGR